jgi:hypothetical protein
LAEEKPATLPTPTSPLNIPTPIPPFVPLSLVPPSPLIPMVGITSVAKTESVIDEALKQVQKQITPTSSNLSPVTIISHCSGETILFFLCSSPLCESFDAHI